MERFAERSGTDDCGPVACPPVAGLTRRAMLATLAGTVFAGFAAAQEQKTEPELRIRHTGRTPDDWWSVTEAGPFTIHHNQDKAFAEGAARVAERTRKEIMRTWFADDEAQEPHPCTVTLYASAEEYRRFTGAPEGSPAHSSIRLDRGRPVGLQIDAHCAEPERLLQAYLPHETVHIAIAGRFNGAHPPRWIDEGMSILAEPKAIIDRQRRRLETLRAEQGLYALKDLMEMADYPERRFVELFYAQSVSIVEFLRDRRNPKTFTAFVRGGLKDGYPAALKKHYDLRFEDLEKAWRGATFPAQVKK